MSPAKASVAFGQACEQAKFESICLPDLRHTADSSLRMQGADIHTVALLLGHRNLRMAVRYQHLSKPYLSDAVKGLDAVFGGLRYQDVTESVGLIEAAAVNA